MRPIREKENRYELQTQWTPPGHHATLREYVETKLERVIRHFDQVIGVSVLLSVDNHKEKNRRQYAEINLHLKGKDVFVESHHEDLYAAIDLLVDKLDRQVIKYKDRVQGHDRDSVKHQALQAVQMQQ